VVVVTHDDRLLPLADQLIVLAPHEPPASAAPVDRRPDAGEVFFRMGDRSDLIFIVDSREIEIARELDPGGEEILARRGPGSCFGEMGPLPGLPRSATARAATECRLTGHSVLGFKEERGIETLDELVRGPSEGPTVRWPGRPAVALVHSGRDGRGDPNSDGRVHRPGGIHRDPHPAGR